MIYSMIVKHNGVCTWPQASSESSSEADKALRRQKAAELFGGSASDYNHVELSKNDYDAIKSNIPGRPIWTEGIVTLNLPPILSMDKTILSADTVEIITISADVGDADYTGLIKWRVRNPNGGVVTAQDNAVAGADDWPLTTDHIGIHRVFVETELHGAASIEFEGTV